MNFKEISGKNVTYDDINSDKKKTKFDTLKVNEKNKLRKNC